MQKDGLSKPSSRLLSPGGSGIIAGYPTYRSSMFDDLRDLYIFEGLSPEQVNYFLMMSEVRQCKPGTVVVTEGDASDDRAYVIRSGTMEILRKGEVVGTLSSGDLFGEIALITNEPRTATVRAKTAAEVLVLNRDEFFLLFKNSDRQREFREEIMRRIQANLKRDAEG